MSDHVEGLVAKISEKAAGKGTVHNVCIESDGQDDEWFGHGFDKPDFFEGDYIEFDIAWNGNYANIDKSTINILEEGDGEQQPSRKPVRSSGRSSGGGRSSRGKPAGRSSSSRSSSSSKPSRNNSSTAKGRPSKGSSDTMSKEEWAQKDQMIRRQACMNTAIKLITLMHTAGVLAKPKTKADGFDALAALCDEEAIRLYDQYQEQVYGGGTKRGRASASDQYDDDIPE